MAKVLVIGNSGTLGRPLVRQLRAKGHDVWQCDLQHSSEPQYIRADIVSYRQLERVFEQGYDYVYHLAAEFGRINREEYYDTLWQTKVVTLEEGVPNTIEWMRQVYRAPEASMDATPLREFVAR